MPKEIFHPVDRSVEQARRDPALRKNMIAQFRRGHKTLSAAPAILEQSLLYLVRAEDRARARDGIRAIKDGLRLIERLLKRLRTAPRVYAAS